MSLTVRTHRITQGVADCADSDSDDFFVVCITDANFSRYGITAEDLKLAMETNPKVKVALLAIGEGAEAAWLPNALPGKAYRVMARPVSFPSNSPPLLKQSRRTRPTSPRTSGRFWARCCPPRFSPLQCAYVMSAHLLCYYHGVDTSNECGGGCLPRLNANATACLPPSQTELLKPPLWHPSVVQVLVQVPAGAS